jgi:hypothetical protein
MNNIYVTMCIYMYVTLIKSGIYIFFWSDNAVLVHALLSIKHFEYIKLIVIFHFSFAISVLQQTSDAMW